MKRGFACTLLGMAEISCAASAYGQPAPEPAAVETQYVLEDHSLRISRAGSSTVFDIGCSGRSMVQAGAKLYVACGAAGVVSIDLSNPVSPRIDGSMSVDGTANEVFLRDGVPWVEIAHLDARPVHVAPPNPSSAPAVAAAPLQPMRPALVEFTRGPDDAPEPARKKETESIVAPSVSRGLWDMTLTTGAFVAFGSLGAGLLGSASVAYRFDWPIVMRAEVAPFGIAGPASATTCCNSNLGTPNTNTGGSVTVFAANFLVGLDTELVEVGLGLGGASVNNSGNGQPSGVAGTGPAETSSVSIVESARIGARDGLALIMESSAIALRSQFQLGYFTMSFQIPVAAKVMLVARGGGGNVGFGYGDLGVRVRVRGDGGKGTVALTGFAGGAMIQENLCSSNTDPPFTTNCNTATLAGPSLGGGIEWKL